MNGKRYFNEIKKNKYAYINYFQSCIIIFLQNHHALQYTSVNIALVSEIRPKKIVTLICLTQFSIFEPRYPASHCTHINTLIAINGLHSSVNFNWRNFFQRLRIQ